MEIHMEKNVLDSTHPKFGIGGAFGLKFILKLMMLTHLFA
jgi:hypothetical protein